MQKVIAVRAQEIEVPPGLSMVRIPTFRDAPDAVNQELSQEEFRIKTFVRPDGTEALFAFDPVLQEVMEAEWKRVHHSPRRLDIDMRLETCRRQRDQAVENFERMASAPFWKRLKALFLGNGVYWGGSASWDTLPYVSAHPDKEGGH